MENEKKILTKRKKIFRYLAFIASTLEVIAFTFEEGLDLYFTDKNNKRLYLKRRLAIFRIIVNLVLYGFMLFIMLRDIQSIILLGGIMYFVLGVIVFLYIFIVENAQAASESRPIEYWDYKIDSWMKALYIISGIFLIVASIMILLCGKYLYDIQKITMEEEKVALQQKYEGSYYKINTKENEGSLLYKE